MNSKDHHKSKSKKSKHDKDLHEESILHRKPRGEGSDAKRVLQRIGDWDYKNSDVYKEINEHFSSGLTQPELLKIAEILANAAHLTIDRDARRDSRVLYRWFYENWEKVGPEMYNITVYDSNSKLISKPSARKPAE